MTNKLMIGAGKSRRSSWLTLDADPNSGADIIAMLPPLPSEVRDRSWQHIEMIHVIEHFYLWDARKLLIEIWHVLEPGGVLVIEAPNILYAARVLCGLEEPPADAEDGKHDMWPLYGSPIGQNPLYGHRWGYSPTSMTEELIAAGFQASDIQVLNARYHVPKRDFRVEAKKASKPRR